MSAVIDKSNTNGQVPMIQIFSETQQLFPTTLIPAKASDLHHIISTTTTPIWICTLCDFNCPDQPRLGQHITTCHSDLNIAIIPTRSQSSLSPPLQPNNNICIGDGTNGGSCYQVSQCWRCNHYVLVDEIDQHVGSHEDYLAKQWEKRFINLNHNTMNDNDPDDNDAQQTNYLSNSCDQCQLFFPSRDQYNTHISLKHDEIINNSQYTLYFGHNSQNSQTTNTHHYTNTHHHTNNMVRNNAFNQSQSKSGPNSIRFSDWFDDDMKDDGRGSGKKGVGDAFLFDFTGQVNNFRYGSAPPPVQSSYDIYPTHDQTSMIETGGYDNNLGYSTTAPPASFVGSSSFVGPRGGRGRVSQNNQQAQPYHSTNYPQSQPLRNTTSTNATGSRQRSSRHANNSNMTYHPPIATVRSESLKQQKQSQQHQANTNSTQNTNLMDTTQLSSTENPPTAMISTSSLVNDPQTSSNSQPRHQFPTGQTPAPVLLPGKRTVAVNYDILQVRVVDGVKHHLCERCSRFVRRIDFHMTQHHHYDSRSRANESMHCCHECGLGFGTRSGYNTHVDDHDRLMGEAFRYNPNLAPIRVMNTNAKYTISRGGGKGNSTNSSSTNTNATTTTTTTPTSTVTPPTMSDDPLFQNSSTAPPSDLTSSQLNRPDTIPTSVTASLNTTSSDLAASTSLPHPHNQHSSSPMIIDHCCPPHQLLPTPPLSRQSTNTNSRSKAAIIIPNQITTLQDQVTSSLPTAFERSTCTRCGSHINTPERQLIHNQQHARFDSNPKSIFSCEYCQLSFERETSFDKHLESVSHQQQKEYVDKTLKPTDSSFCKRCKIVWQIDATEHHWHLHQLFDLKKDANILKCFLCEFGFDTAQALEKHQEMIHNGAGGRRRRGSSGGGR